MSQLWFYAGLSRLTGLGYRAKVLALAAVGVLALPMVIAVLMGRGVLPVTSPMTSPMTWGAPVLAMASAAVVAIATVIGIDLLLRPVSLTGQALRRVLQGDVPAALPDHFTDVAGRLMTDAQRVIDEVIALRAEHLGDEHPIVAFGQGGRFAVPFTALSGTGPDTGDDPLVLEQDLRSAIANQEFELYYQPVMDLDLGQPVGAEALIRWNSPSRGFVAPARFIPLAEATGLIEPIGLWVLRNACQQAAGWDPQMRVSVNLGAGQFMDEDLGWQIADAIATAGLRPDQLVIELTETMALLDYDHSRRLLTQLRDSGVQIALDDFGTGFASLRTLRQLPIDILKIDREFVTDVHTSPDAQAICAALLTLGQGLGIRVLAEGTETAQEVAYLHRHGCKQFQGYYFARPVPAHVLGATFDNLRLRQAG